MTPTSKPPVTIPPIETDNDNPQPGEGFLHWLYRVHPENQNIAAALGYQISSYEPIIHGDWKLGYQMALLERAPAPQPDEVRTGDIAAPAEDDSEQWAWIIIHPTLWLRLAGNAQYINQMQVKIFYNYLASFNPANYTGPRWGV